MSVSVCVYVSVCLSVCLSDSVREFVCLLSYLRNDTRPIFINFLCVLPMAVARSSSGGVVMRYVLPVLWVTSYLHIRLLAARRRHQADAARLTRTQP